MKKIFKSPPPNELTEYAKLFPNSTWEDDFRNHATPIDKPGSDYKKIKDKLLKDQGNLCAYCEKNMQNLTKNLQRVEHFHPKSDKSDPLTNWGLCWDNIIIVCTGGENDDGETFPRPENLSCDAHKNRWLTGKKFTASATITEIGGIKNPLGMESFPCIFKFDKKDYKINPKEEYCEAVDKRDGLVTGTTFKALEKTINTVLNLNCDRLCTERRQVLIQYNQEIKKARETSNENIHQELANKWFQTKWPSYFTTRRILLGSAAETKLTAIKYAG